VSYRSLLCRLADSDRQLVGNTPVIRASYLREPTPCTGNMNDAKCPRPFCRYKIVRSLPCRHRQSYMI
ncbi:hypothetical protein THOM_0455, partial [Trachipleistophora hominis]